MEKLRVDLSALAEIVSDKAVLEALQQTTFSINGIYDTSRLLERLLERIFSLIPAERGAVLFTNRNTDTLDCAAFRNSPPDVNRDIATEAISEQSGIINDKSGASIICVPLTVFDSVLGVIYLDSTQKDVFRRSHLHLLIAISIITAVLLEHTRYIDRLENENQRLHQEIEQEYSANLEIIGDSPRMHDVRNFIGKVAPSDANVLILGPSGTGKELVARAIHQKSRRAAGPFVAVNCGAITPTLVESELFGYEKGAFTGAAKQEKGKFEVADGGTIFLDEVGELTMPMQAALLRVLQEHEFHRVGGTRQVSVDVRVVAATNRNLEARMQEERFREDLYFRLRVVQLQMPSLAECREDIPRLASHFLQRFRYKRVTSGFSTEAQRILTAYNWPGNVRELQHAVDHALLLGTSDVIQPEDLPEYVRNPKPTRSGKAGSYQAQVRLLKRTIVERALTEAKGNHAEAARSLAVSPSYFRRLAQQLKIALS